jgi:hypothetical protein
MAIAGVGRVYLWHGGSLWIGHSAGGGNVHAHHALQICLPLDVRVRFRRSATADWDDYDGAIVGQTSRTSSTAATGAWRSCSSSRRPRSAACSWIRRPACRSRR